jgi:hypothetical protein
MRRTTSFLIGLFAVFWADAPAALAQEEIAPLPSSESVSPASITYPTALPLAGEPTGPAQHRVRGIGGKDPAYRRMIDSLKQIPIPIQRDGQITIDRSTSARAETDAPALGLNFEGVVQGNWIPGEPVVAVGPTNLICVGNTSIRIFSKSGSLLVNALSTDWYGMTDNHFDPKVLYDAPGGRFLMLWAFQVDVGGSQNDTSYYILSVSQTSDATGPWYNYRLNMRLDGSTQTNNWADFPGLGLDDSTIYLTANMYTFSGGNFQYAKLRALRKSTVCAGAPVPWTDFINMTDVGGSKSFTLKPAHSLSSTLIGYLLNTKSGGGSVVNFWKVTGGPGSPTLTNLGALSIASYSVPPNAPQQGTSNTIETNDCRTQEVVFRDGYVYTAWNIGTNFGSGNVAAIRYVKINAATNAVTTDETYGAATTHYYYPAVTVDPAGSVHIGFGRSNSSEYSSAWYSGRRSSDAAIEPSALLKSGITGYGNSRWGDYAGIGLDPSPAGGDSGVAWCSGQWAEGSNTWGSWIGKLAFRYDRIYATVLHDADGDSVTSDDRTPLANWIATLKQGATTVRADTSNASGLLNNVYLEDGTYTLQLMMQSNWRALSAQPGSGGTSQTRIDTATFQINVINGQTSTNNVSLVYPSSLHRAVASGNWYSPTTWDGGVPPYGSNVTIQTSASITIDGDITTNNLVVNGSLQFDGTNGRSATINGTLKLAATGLFTIGSNSLALNGPPIAGSQTNLSAGSTSSLIFGGSSTGISVPSGISALASLTTNNASGVSLDHDLTVLSTLSMESGELAVGAGATIVIASTDSDAVVVNSGTLRGSMRRTIPTAATGPFRFTSRHAYLQPEIVPAPVTVDFAAHPRTNIPAGDTALAIKRYYTISPGGPLTATVRLAYDDSELRAGMDELQLSLWRYKTTPPPAAWVDESVLQFSTTENWVEQAGISSWSNWTLAPSGSPLPIQLATFTATVINGSDVMLEWLVVSQTNNYGFIVQQAAESSAAFVDVPNSFIPGHGTTTQPQSYSFLHQNVQAGSYRYRLKQIDLDGTIHYSWPIYVSFAPLFTTDERVPIVFGLQQNYPNPFNPGTDFELRIAESRFVTLKIFDILGREVAVIVNEVKPRGVYRVRWDASAQSGGVYLARLTAGNLTEIRKLILMK